MGNRAGGGGDGGGEDGKNAVYPFDAGEYSNVYVSGSGDDENNSGEDEGSPLKTLAAAYTKATDTDPVKRIVVLTNLSGEEAVKFNSSQESPVIIEGRHYDLKIERSGGADGSVIEISGGAKINFKNIFINGKTNTNVYHRALLVKGDGTEVTLLDGAKAAGMKIGPTVAENSGQGSGIRVCDQATLVMEEGSSVAGCAYIGTGGFGTVMVQTGATFEMNGGAISRNTSQRAAAVYVYSGADEKGSTFTLNGGSLSSNIATDQAGGVFVLSNGAVSTFAMNGGTVSNNSANISSGICVASDNISNKSVFTMSGGSISGNTCSSNVGGGIYLVKSTFTMTGGDITGNKAEQGAGMKLNESEFTMSGESEIRANIATGTGGGLYIGTKSTFIMNGGTISLNEAGNGGGVYMHNNYTSFTFNGGVICGLGDPAYLSLRNTAGTYAALEIYSGSNVTLNPVAMHSTDNTLIAGVIQGEDD
jgi:parallel beta-helix repeat protein